jgi:hypothetical protein
MFSQVKALTEEEEKSLTAFDFSEFQYPYKRVKGNYSHLANIKDAETLGNLLDMLIMFCVAGARPHHIEIDLFRNLHAFGRDGFFNTDIVILENWCRSLLEVNKAIEQSF